MKKWICTTAMLALVACGTLAPAEKETHRVAWTQTVEKMLADRHYTIDVQMMYPHRGTARNVVGNYSLEVRGDTLVSYLPYFGRAYQVPYGGGKGLNFSEVMENYSAVMNAQGQTIVTIGLTNEEDTYQYTLSIFDNGSTTIDVHARQRDPITFSGMIVEDDDNR